MKTTGPAKICMPAPKSYYESGEVLKWPCHDKVLQRSQHRSLQYGQNKQPGVV